MKPFAQVAISTDADPRRAGLLAASEASLELVREKVGTVLLFASGAHQAAAIEVARGARETLPAANIIAVGGLGALSGKGESDAASGPSVVAMAFACESVIAATSIDDKEMDAAKLTEGLVHRTRPLLLFRRHNEADESYLADVEKFADHIGDAPLLGAGVPEEGSIAAVIDGAPKALTAVALRLDGGMRMLVGSSAGITPITEMMSIDAIDDGLLTLLGGDPPLNVLERAVLSLEKEVIVLCSVLRGQEAHTQPSIINIRGVSPPDSIRVQADLRVGDQLAFAMLDPEAARSDFEAMVRNLKSELRGGVPCAGLLFDCDVRGRPLHGQAAVDVGLAVTRFPSLPLAGMRTPFEIATEEGYPTLRHYSAVFGLLYKPS